MHGRAGVCLGNDEPLRVQRPGPHLGRQGGERTRPLPVVPQDAKAGAGHGRQLEQPVGAGLQVVFPVAEEGEMALGQPVQQLSDLARGVCAARSLAFGRQHVIGQRQGPGPHPPVILDRNTHVTEHPEQVRRDRRDLAASQRRNLDVGP